MGGAQSVRSVPIESAASFAEKSAKCVLLHIVDTK
jgi:hypothetical protein